MLHWHGTYKISNQSNHTKQDQGHVLCHLMMHTKSVFVITPHRKKKKGKKTNKHFIILIFTDFYVLQRDQVEIKVRHQFK